MSIWRWLAGSFPLSRFCFIINYRAFDWNCFKKELFFFFLKLGRTQTAKIGLMYSPQLSPSLYYPLSFFYINWNKQGFYIRVSLGQISVLRTRIFISKNIKNTPRSSIRNVLTIEKKGDVMRLGPSWSVWPSVLGPGLRVLPEEVCSLGEEPGRGAACVGVLRGLRVLPGAVRERSKHLVRRPPSGVFR